MFAWIRMIVAAICFAQALRWAWAWARPRHALPLYAHLPWDPSAVLRVTALSPTETDWARRLERDALTGAATMQGSS